MLSESQRLVLFQICGENEAAREFCFTFVNWCHWIDDVIDGDDKWTPGGILKLNFFDLARTFSRNSFFQEHKRSLVPLIVQAFNAYLDSELMRQAPKVEDRRAADVLKSWYHEVVWHVAYLIGGWNGLRMTTTSFRQFDYDNKE